MSESAKGIQAHPQYKLGSILGSGKADDRTLRLSDFVESTVQAPVSWDFDKGIKAFPPRMWGNDQYGNCEIAGRCNYLMRTQRTQTKLTIDLENKDAISIYKQMTGCQSPGDANDTGLTTLDNLKQWKSGWEITKKWPVGGEETRAYHISAYGLIDTTNASLLRTCMYLFSGCLFGIALPITAQAQTEAGGPWDVVDPNLTGDSEPGSWGGHCVYDIAYDADTVTVLTWEKRIKMTQAFIDAYVMEGYSVIDSFDTWYDFPHALDVPTLIQEMRNIGINVNQ